MAAEVSLCPLCVVKSFIKLSLERGGNLMILDPIEYKSLATIEEIWKHLPNWTKPGIADSMLLAISVAIPFVVFSS